MASLHKRGEVYLIRFGRVIRGRDRRQSIRLGKLSKRDALAARRHIETLWECRQLGTPAPVSTRNWLASLPAEVQNRIADKQLCAPRVTATHTVGGICEAFVAWKRDCDRAESSLDVYRKSTRMLVAYFGGDRDIASIVPAEIDDFVEWCRRSGLAATTLSRRLQNCKSIFRRAARMGWLPLLTFYQLFDSLPKQVRTDATRRHMVPAEAVLKAIDHASDNEQRLIFALARWGGVRVPSELLGLTWGDVAVDSQKIRVRSPKQRHNDASLHERWLPIWPEIRPYLDEAEREWNQRNYHRDPDRAPLLSDPIIYRYRSPNTSAHRRLFLLACYRAGLTASRDAAPWPKLWTNMRSTRVTELRQSFPPDAVNYWMNHSEQISRAHYQQWEQFEWREKV